MNSRRKKPLKMILPNKLLLSRAVEAVQQGGVAKIPVLGQSMDPFICGKRDCVELYPPQDVVVGDVVLAKVTAEQYLLHRIFRFEGREGVILMGDGNVTNQERCFRSDIKAKAQIIIKEDGRRIDLTSKSMMWAAKIWRWLLPCRCILLRIYRKFLR